MLLMAGMREELDPTGGRVLRAARQRATRLGRTLPSWIAMAGDTGTC